MCNFSAKKILLGALFLCCTSTAIAGSRVTVEVFAEKLVVLEENGETVSKRINAENIQPGEIIFYTLKYSNAGDSVARDVVINDPVPEKTTYIAGSAFGYQPLFSIDGGKHYSRPDLLVHVFKTPSGKEEQRVASPDEYTHIRWVVDEIKAGESGTVGFQVRVK